MLALVFMRLAIICICLHLNFCLGRTAIKTEVTIYDQYLYYVVESSFYSFLKDTIMHLQIKQVDILGGSYLPNLHCQ